MTSGVFLNSAVGQADHRKDIFGDHEEEDVPRSPSIFSIAASDGLRSTMRPALEHLLWVLASKFPERLGNMYQLSDEIIVALEFLLQHHYLSKYSALFAEHFYGIKRTKIVNVGQINNFVTDRHNLITQALIFHLILPYIRLKLTRLYHAVKEKYLEPLRPNVKDRLLCSPENIISFVIYVDSRS